VRPADQGKCFAAGVQLVHAHMVCTGSDDPRESLEQRHPFKQWQQ